MKVLYEFQETQYFSVAFDWRARQNGAECCIRLNISTTMHSSELNMISPMTTTTNHDTHRCLPRASFAIRSSFMSSSATKANSTRSSSVSAAGAPQEISRSRAAAIPTPTPANRRLI